MLMILLADLLISLDIENDSYVSRAIELYQSAIKRKEGPSGNVTTGKFAHTEVERERKTMYLVLWSCTTRR